MLYTVVQCSRWVIMPPSLENGSTALKMINPAHQRYTSNGKMKEDPLRNLKMGPPKFFNEFDEYMTFPIHRIFDEDYIAMGWSYSSGSVASLSSSSSVFLSWLAFLCVNPLTMVSSIIHSE